MKKHAIAAFVCIAASVISGCKKDPGTPDKPEDSNNIFSVKMTSTDMIASDLGTKSTAAGGIISFSAGDKIGIMGDNLDYVSYSVKDSGTESELVPDTQTAPNWESAGKYTYYAVSPFAEYSDDRFSISVPAEQTLSDGVSTVAIPAFGSCTHDFNGTDKPSRIKIDMVPYSGIFEIVLPGTGIRLSGIEIAPISESDLSGGFASEIVISKDGSAKTTSSGKTLKLNFEGKDGNFLDLSSGKTIYVPVGEFSLSAGNGLRFTFTLDNGTVKTRTVFAGEEVASYTEIDGKKHYQHLSLQFASLDQMESILYETFGTEGNASKLESNNSGSLYQLAKYYTGYKPEGTGSKSAAYWSGLRVDLRQNRFRADGVAENDSYVYFGNSNNNVVGTGSAGTITDIKGYTACADQTEDALKYLNDRLAFYIYNVNIGKGCQKAQISFDVSTGGHNEVVAACGEGPFYEALKKLIKVEYTTDHGYSWQDMSNLSGTSESSEIWRYTSATADLSGYNDEFITFRIRATMKQTLNIDNLSVETIGSSAITESQAPSIVEIYRQTPSTAYLVCRPAASVHMSQADMMAVVPYIGNTPEGVAAWSDFEVRNADEKYQVFEILLKGLQTTGNDLYAALNWNGQTGGRKYTYESFDNEIFNVNFDRFTDGANPVHSIAIGWRLSGSISTFASPNGKGAKEYDTKYSRQFDTHNPGRREEVFGEYAAAPDGGFMSGGKIHRGTNNMEASFRNTEGISPSPDVTTDGAVSAGKFFKYDCELDGWTGTSMYELEGYMQLGTGSSKGWDDAAAGNQAWICTPKIGEKHIPAGSTAQVELSFETAKYNATTSSEVEVIRIEGETKTSLGRYPVGGYGAFKKSSVLVKDATSETKFLIGAPTGTTTGGAGRFYIDNISVRK